MPFNARNFKLMYHGAPALQVSGLTARRPVAFFHYTTNESLPTVLALGYFNDARRDLGLQAGDYILAQCSVDVHPIDIVSMQLVVTDSLSTNVAVSLHETGSNLFWNNATGATGANTTETTLYSATILGGLMNHNFMGVHMRAMLTTAANGNNKTVTVKFGGTTLATSGAVASNNEAWWIEAQVTRTGPSAQQAFCRMMRSTTVVALAYSTPAEDMTVNTPFAVTGTNGTASANDIVLRAAQVQMIA